jgi:predicted ATPase
VAVQRQALTPLGLNLTQFWPSESAALCDFFRKLVHADPFRRVDFQAQISPQPTVDATGVDLARVLHFHYNNDRERFDRYEETVMKVVPDIRMIETPIVGGATATVSLRFLDDLEAYNLQQLSSGLKDVLVLLAALHFSPPGSLLIVEEPENHLHPAAQNSLAAVFKEIATAEQKQLILTTHSDVIVSQFPPTAVLFVDRRSADRRAIPLEQVDAYSMWQQLG